MKRLLKASAAAGLVLALAAPVAMAQTTTDTHAKAHDTAKVHDSGNHDKIVSHDTTVQHETIVNQRPAGPWDPHGPAGGFLPGHAPGDNRLPIYTQPGDGHGGYALGGGHQWHRGDRYDGPRNVVTNWDEHHLQRPPPGYEYVQDGSQFVLIAVASGVIADILLNH